MERSDESERERERTAEKTVEENGKVTVLGDGQIGERRRERERKKEENSPGRRQES